MQPDRAAKRDDCCDLADAAEHDCEANEHAASCQSTDQNSIQQFKSSRTRNPARWHLSVAFEHAASSGLISDKECHGGKNSAAT